MFGDGAAEIASGYQRWFEQQLANARLAKCDAFFGVEAPGFITGDWSVEYPPIAEQSYQPVDVTGLKPPQSGWRRITIEKPRDSFPAAAMRDSAF